MKPKNVITIAITITIAIAIDVVDCQRVRDYRYDGHEEPETHHQYVSHEINEGDRPRYSQQLPDDYEEVLNQRPKYHPQDYHHRIHHSQQQHQNSGPHQHNGYNDDDIRQSLGQAFNYAQDHLTHHPQDYQNHQGGDNYVHNYGQNHPDHGHNYHQDDHRERERHQHGGNFEVLNPHLEDGDQHGGQGHGLTEINGPQDDSNSYVPPHVVFEEASRYIMRRFNLTTDELVHLVHEDEQGGLGGIDIKRICPAAMTTAKCYRSKYRTIDGSCNNLHNPKWGKSRECEIRLLPAEYGDGISTPRMSVTGHQLPNPRMISNVIHEQIDIPFHLNHLFQQYGQFLDHDLSQQVLPSLEIPGRPERPCCPTPRHPDCLPIFIPKDDPFYTKRGVDCLNFVRTVPCETCQFGPREHLNNVTAYMDASQVYGSLYNVSLAIRLDNGLMLLSEDIHHRGVLPHAINRRQDQCTALGISPVCYRTGDTRVNQHPALTAHHTLFIRQHNRIAHILSSINPHWDGDTLYYETRRIIGAQLQVINYGEYLPLLIGPEAMTHYNLWLLNGAERTEYDHRIQAQILQESATAAMRYAHSLVDGRFAKVYTNGSATFFDVRERFFQPLDIHLGQFDAIFRGLLAEQPDNIMDTALHGDVRNFLYRPTADFPFGFDLAAFNIQRGRERGIPGYVKYLEYCFNDHDIKDFKDLRRYIPRKVIKMLQQVYQRVEDIDLFTGGTAEIPVKGGIVGPTFACIIGHQFHLLRFGDRYWFEHDHQDGSFTDGQLKALRKTRLSKIICENGDDFPVIQNHVFHFVSDENPLVPCTNLPDVDLTEWRETKWVGKNLPESDNEYYHN